jgi:hypothetical protein
MVNFFFSFLSSFHINFLAGLPEGYTIHEPSIHFTGLGFYPLAFCVARDEDLRRRSACLLLILWVVSSEYFATQ